MGIARLVKQLVSTTSRTGKAAPAGASSTLAQLRGGQASVRIVGNIVELKGAPYLGSKGNTLSLSPKEAKGLRDLLARGPDSILRNDSSPFSQRVANSIDVHRKGDFYEFSRHYFGLSGVDQVAVEVSDLPALFKVLDQFAKQT